MVDRRYQVDTKKQVVKWLRNEDDRSRMDDTGDNPFDDGLDEEDSNYMSDEAANKRALQYMMTGEYPDAEIDKLLETFGIQVSQIGSMSEKDIFQGQLIENDLRINVELRDQIDEIKFTYKNWSTLKMTDKKRKAFLQTLCDQAEYLGVSLAVEHLLPNLLDLMTNKSLDQDKYQDCVILLFSQLEKLIRFLSRSEITAGYEAIRDHLTPIYNEYFLSGYLEDDVRLQL